MNAAVRVWITGLALGLGITSSAWATGQAGVMLATVGEVTVQRGNATLPAPRRTTLEVDDTVHTGSNARAQLRFDDGTVTTLGADTTYRILRYRWKPTNQQPNDMQFELVTGAFRTITGAGLNTPDATFAVKTPAGNLGIRGTDFWGGYLDGDSVDVLLIKGDHALEVSNRNGTVMLKKDGEGTTLKADQSTLGVKSWPTAKVGRAVTTVAWPEDKDMPEGVFKATVIPALTLNDQHGKPHTLDDSVQRILFIRDMGGARLLRKVFTQHPAVIDGTHTVAIGNFSEMNGFIRRAMTVPALRKRPYAIWVDTTGASKDLPALEEQVTVMEINQRTITRIRYAADENSLRQLVNLPAATH